MKIFFAVLKADLRLMCPFRPMLVERSSLLGCLQFFLYLLVKGEWISASEYASFAQILKGRWDEEMASFLIKRSRVNLVPPRSSMASSANLGSGQHSQISMRRYIAFCLNPSQNKILSVSTILNYQISLVHPILFASGVDLTDSDFKDLDEFLY